MTQNDDATNATLEQRWHENMAPNYRPQPITIVRGEGCTVWDAEGNAYLDLMGGIATVALGHCHPKLVAALQEQSQKLWHVSNIFSSEPQIELAERLLSHCFAERVYFCNSGAEANEAALKLARRWQWTQKRDRFEIVSFEGSFHGRTLFTVTATGQPRYREGFEPVVPGIHHAPFGDLAATKDLVGPHTAAILVECVQGEGGVRPAPPGFLQGLRELADANDCLLIFDEIQTGMGRCGPLFAHEAFDVVPDIMTLAKALGNGIPIGAMLTREDVAAALTFGSHGSTFGGNPLAAACATALVDELIDGGVLEHAQEVGDYLGEKLAALARRLGPDKVVECRGMGHLRAIEITGEAAAVMAACREQGVLVISAGPKVVRLAPALVIDKREIDRGLEVLEAALAG